MDIYWIKIGMDEFGCPLDFQDNSITNQIQLYFKISIQSNCNWISNQIDWFIIGSVPNR